MSSGSLFVWSGVDGEDRNTLVSGHTDPIFGVFHDFTCPEEAELEGLIGNREAFMTPVWEEYGVDEECWPPECVGHGMCKEATR